MSLDQPPQPMCMGCLLYPYQLSCYTSVLSCYTSVAGEYGFSPDEYVRQEEGTYNPINGHFLCDECYIEAGMPTLAGGWVCP